MKLNANMPTILHVLCRLVLGIVFLLSALGKAAHLEAFYQAADHYQVLPPVLTSLYAGLLPWLEGLAGLYLILGLFMRFTAVLTGGLLLTFLIAIVTVLVRGDSVDCGCFIGGGARPTPIGWDTLARDVAMLGASIYLYISKAQAWALDAWLSRPD